jgi:HK97 family phage prohead protease
VKELRYHSTPIEVRTEDGAAPVLTGYGAVFNRLSQNLGGFVEQVDPEAFTTTLSTGRNILGAVNHDVSWLLATTESGTLAVEPDGTGLRFAMTLDPEDPDAVRAMAKVRTGKLPGASFTFATRDDEWGTTEQGFPLRTLRSVELYELGPVAAPAYLSTQDAGNAVALRSLASFVDLPIEQVTEAARTGALTDLILRDLPDLAAAQDEAPTPPVDNQGEDQAPRRGRRNPPPR